MQFQKIVFFFIISVWFKVAQSCVQRYEMVPPLLTETIQLLP